MPWQHCGFFPVGLKELSNEILCFDSHTHYPVVAVQPIVEKVFQLTVAAVRFL